MCGIFGILVNEQSRFTNSSYEAALNQLFTLSESRGKEAAGLAVMREDSIQVYKQPIAATTMIKQKPYREIFNHPRSNGNSNPSFSAIGHSRLVTNGTEDEHENNQPVATNGLVGIHNGIIVNDEQLWQKYPSLKRKFIVDTEVIFSLIAHHYDHERQPLIKAVQQTFQELEGAASIAVLFEALNHLVLTTNNGSLYLLRNKAQNTVIFASEHYILKTLMKKSTLSSQVGDYTIDHVKPGEGYVVNLGNLETTYFELESETTPDLKIDLFDSKRVPVDIVERLGLKGKFRSPIIHRPNPGDRNAPKVQVPQEFTKHFDQCERAIDNLRRCTRCVLPETMPFIDFDEQGVCSYCRNYQGLGLKGAPAMKELLEPVKRANGEPDVLVGLSGGRDSTYALHYLVTEIGLKPIAYTYDWGMITDLARRNISRICGKLGIENILVSADINRKRANIRRNVGAWLKKPELGMVPLFMAGDKQYFYYAAKLRSQNQLEMTIFGDNLFERTNFKAGFCGVAPKTFTKERINTLTLGNKTKMISYYLGQYLTNPGYLNQSLWDSFIAFGSYYVMPHNYLNIYSYIPWVEEIVTQTIIEEYDWEIAGDTKTTWRIGDGTASFYNYIYYVLSGLTENDTFRSNQIREGHITREQGLRDIQRDNKPRFDSIKWYCDTIGIDFEYAIKQINSGRKRYQLDQ